jgi:hypothetical protein
MTNTMIKERQHYSAPRLTRIKAALAMITPENQGLTVAQLAPLDQFHTRRILATAELARAAELDPSTRVLEAVLDLKRRNNLVAANEWARVNSSVFGAGAVAALAGAGCAKQVQRSAMLARSIHGARIGVGELEPGSLASVIEYRVRPRACERRSAGILPRRLYFLLA